MAHQLALRFDDVQGDHLVAVEPSGGQIWRQFDLVAPGADPSSQPVLGRVCHSQPPAADLEDANLPGASTLKPMDSHPEVVTVGHAIVDVLAPSEDELVAGFGLQKGTMTLVDDARAEKIYASLGPATEVSGGSAANTAACLASLGAVSAFIGKVRDDTLGQFFTHDIRAAGVQYAMAPSPVGPGTGCCLIMVTPDAEKTMCTNLGIGALLEADDVDAAAIAAARVMYVEGYLYGDRPTNPAVERAIAAAREAGDGRGPVAVGSLLGRVARRRDWPASWTGWICSSPTSRRPAGSWVRRTWIGPWRPWPAAVRRSP